MPTADFFSKAWEVIQTLIALATPIALVYISARVNSKAKKEDREYESKKSNEEAKHKQLVDKIDGLATQMNDKMTTMKSEIESLRSEINTDKANLGALQDDIAHTAALNRMNGQYTHQVAQLVVVLAEGIRDQHLDGNITRAVAKYRQFESDTLGSIITGHDLGDDGKKSH